MPGASSQRSGPRARDADRALFPHTLLNAIALALRLDQPAHSGVELYLDSFRAGPWLRRDLAALALDLRSGTTLHEAMGRLPGRFPAWLVALAQWGCAAGRPADALEQGACVLAWERRLVETVRSGLLYPALVLGLWGWYGVMVSRLIVPLRGAPGVRDTDPTLIAWIHSHVLSRLPQGFSDVAGGLAISVCFSIWAGSYLPVARWRHGLVMDWLVALPGGRQALVIARAAVVARCLAGSIAGGQPLDRALDHAAATSDQRALKEALARAALEVRGGRSPRAALCATGGPAAPVLFRIAGCLDAADAPAALARLAADLEGEAELASRALTTCVAPVVTLLAGVTLAVAAMTQVCALNATAASTAHALGGG